MHRRSVPKEVSYVNIQPKTTTKFTQGYSRGIVAFLVAYTTHLGPVRAAEAVERFGDRVFDVIRERPEELCVIKGITPARAQVIHESFGTVAPIANVDSWLRHIGLGKADARRVREVYGPDAAELVREPVPAGRRDPRHRLFTTDSLRVMLRIGPYLAVPPVCRVEVRALPGCSDRGSRVRAAG